MEINSNILSWKSKIFIVFLMLAAESVKLSSARNMSFILKLVNEILCIWPTDSLSEMSGTLYMVYNPTKRTIK